MYHLISVSSLRTQACVYVCLFLCLGKQCAYITWRREEEKETIQWLWVCRCSSEYLCMWRSVIFLCSLFCILSIHVRDEYNFHPALIHSRSESPAYSSCSQTVVRSCSWSQVQSNNVLPCDYAAPRLTRWALSFLSHFP